MYNNADSPSLTWRPRLKVYTGGQNNVFNPETFEARSYKWWVYVKKIKGKVIFNNYNYSHTTCNHQRKMRELLKQLKVKNIEFISQRESLSDGIVLDAVYKTMYLAELRLNSKGRKDSFYKDQQSIIKQCKEKIKRLKSLGGKASEPLEKLKADVTESENNRLDRQRRISAEQRVKRKALLDEHGKEVLNNTDAVSI